MSVGRPDSSTTRAQIEACIRDRAFHLVYQPIVHLDTGQPAGVEALCRFEDGASPQRRFQQAEALGRAADLDLAIIEAVLAELPALPEGYVSINLSPSTVLDGRIRDALLAGTPTERIVIEITEHAPVPDYEKADQLLSALRASGIRLAVDDAGAGYSTFRHILRLRPDIIKMDRSITHDIDSDTARRALATALVIFGGEIGAIVVAEGVETTAEVLALRRAGIHRAQGFLLAPPAPLPLRPIGYEPLPLSDLLDLPARTSERVPLDEATMAVRAHGLLAGMDAIEGVLDMLNERLAAIGEDRYRDLVGTAQRQAHHVGGALRHLVRGFPAEALSIEDAVGLARVPRSERVASPSSKQCRGRSAADPDAVAIDEESARSRARRRLRAAVDALHGAQSEIEDTVALGRKAGVSWDEVAEILGMTRQGVSKRFGRVRRA